MSRKFPIAFRHHSGSAELSLHSCDHKTCPETPTPCCGSSLQTPSQQRSCNLYRVDDAECISARFVFEGSPKRPYARPEQICDHLLMFLKNSIFCVYRYAVIHCKNVGGADFERRNKAVWIVGLDISYCI